jgi:ADP-dependent NAD(P)H-hydrate dehydratase / NAD(P)H-hydrate epimerase
VRSVWSKYSVTPPLEAPSPEEMRSHELYFISTETRKKGNASIEQQLMECAGRRCADVVMRQRGLRSVVVFSGSGNNGGDGLIIARELIALGREVLAVLLPSSRYSPLCAMQIESLLKVAPESIRILSSSNIANPYTSELRTVSLSEIENTCKTADCVIDALLGIGQFGELRDTVAELASIINNSGTVVYSVDAPTGVNTGNGRSATLCVHAHHTLCIEYIKRGLLQYPARSYCGEIHCIPIGLEGISECSYNILDERSLSLLRKRSSDSHKGTYGHVLVIGGSPAMPGASILAAEAALRVGAGKVTFTSHANTMAPVFLPELMQYPVPNGWEENTLGTLGNFLDDIDAVVVGPGLGSEKTTQTFLLQLLDILSKHKVPHVVDADALACLVEHTYQLDPSLAVLTPHPGEAARLLHFSTSQIQEDRFAAAEKIFDHYGATVVLKGAGTVLWDGKQGWINTSGTHHLATAGSGDILAGMLASFLAQKYPVSEASRLAVYLHGRLGDVLVARSSAPTIASQLLSVLPMVLSNG